MLTGLWLQPNNRLGQASAAVTGYAAHCSWPRWYLIQSNSGLTRFPNLASPQVAEYAALHKDVSEEMSRSPKLAGVFHEIAWPFLSSLGFQLQNDPNQNQSPYLGTRALYKSQSGFFLSVGFEPLDGGFAGIMCGRSWNYTSTLPKLARFERLSHHYRVLADRFGYDVPQSFKLQSDDEEDSDLHSILDILAMTLPGILEHVTLEDLVAIEKQEYGRQWMRAQGEDSSSSITFEGITPFREMKTPD